MNKNIYPKILLGIFIIFWIVTAINPADRGVWVLENIIVVLFIPFLIFTHKKFKFSNISYTLIFTFMILHIIGAFYTYSANPLGFWLQDTFDLTRNHFDRIVHFSFGLLMVYPVRDLYIKLVNSKKFTYFIPFWFTLSLSTFYELLEWGIVFIADPAAGANYLGMQGDIWDAQKDMVLAFFGALITIGIMGFVNKIRKS